MKFKTSTEIFAHIDCNSFFVACEIIRNPSLKNKFVCVGDQIIIASSYEAKKYGIKTGTPVWEARRILGNKLIMKLPDHSFYSSISTRLMDYMKALVGEIEIFSIDEFFCNLTGFGNTEDYSKIAIKLQNEIYKNIGLPVSVGIANTRIQAKIFSEINKPLGHFVCFNKQNKEKIFKKLPIRDIPYIGKQNSEKLGVRYKTIYDFYIENPLKIKSILGQNGFSLWLELNGIDVWKPHDSNKKRKSIVASRSFNHNMTSEYGVLWRNLMENLERAYNTLITEKQETRILTIFLKDREFVIYEKSFDFEEGTIDRIKIVKKAQELFGFLYSASKIYRTTGIVFGDLKPYNPKQISIFDTENNIHKNNDKLTGVLLNLKNNYGENIISRGFFKKNKENSGVEVLFEVS